MFGAGRPVPLSPQAAMQYALEGAVLLDVRPEYETDFRRFDLPEVFLIPLEGYKEQCRKVPKEKTVIVVDSVGLFGSMVAKFLSGQGYERTGYVVGGIIAWEQAGLPLVRDMRIGITGEAGFSPGMQGDKGGV